MPFLSHLDMTSNKNRKMKTNQVFLVMAKSFLKDKSKLMMTLYVKESNLSDRAKS